MKLISRITAEKLKEGDELAFEEIFYAYRNIVFFECLKKIRNTQDANDCVQEIFIKLVEKINLFDSNIAEFNAWFRTLYINHIYDFLRKQRNYNEHVSTIAYEDMCEVAAKEESKSSSIELMSELINIVGEEAYTILIYKIKNKLSFRQIAKLMEKTFYEVRTIYNKAMAELKTKLKYFYKIFTKINQKRFFKRNIHNEGQKTCLFQFQIGVMLYKVKGRDAHVVFKC